MATLQQRMDKLADRQAKLGERIKVMEQTMDLDVARVALIAGKLNRPIEIGTEEKAGRRRDPKPVIWRRDPRPVEKEPLNERIDKYIDKALSTAEPAKPKRRKRDPSRKATASKEDHAQPETQPEPRKEEQPKVVVSAYGQACAA